MSLTDAINYANELNNEYNIKLFILIVLFVYSALAIYFSKLKDDDRYQDIFLKVVIFKIPGTIMFFLFPLFSAFLYRDVAASVLYGFVVGFYGIYMTLIFLIVIFYGTDFLLKLFGFDLGDWKQLKGSYKKYVVRK